MLKIRLRRMGAIRQPHYRIVVMEARTPRDGRSIDTLGHYNPLTQPATIQVDVAKYEEWRTKGAQPTEAVVSLVRQFNRTNRNAAAAATAAAAAPAPAPAQATGTAAPVASNAEPDADAANVPTDAPMNEGMAEATRDGGEGSDALIGASADDAGSANPGAASDQTDARIEG